MSEPIIQNCMLCMPRRTDNTTSNAADNATDPLVIWQGDDFYVIHAQEENFPAFYRLIWNTHVTEFSELTPDERYRCTDALVTVERVLREQLQPTKVNVASLGNQTPHLHWHIIARFAWDSHFPGAVWGTAQQNVDDDKINALAANIPSINQQIAARLSARFL